MRANVKAKREANLMRACRLNAGLKLFVVSLTLVGTVGVVAITSSVCAEDNGRSVPVKREFRRVGLSETFKVTETSVGKAKVTTKLPRYSGDPSLSVSRTNNLIKNAMDAEIKKMTSEQKEQEEGFKYSAEGTTSYSSTDFISMVVEYSSFTGGAHGNSFIKSYNVRLKPFKELALDDVLGGPVDYRILSDLAQIELFKQLKGGDKGMVESGTGPFAKNFDTFTFDKKGVTFHFDPYQVAPYSEGAPKVTLSYSVLKPLVRSNSVVSGWVHGVKPAPIASDDTLRSQQKQAALKEFLKRTKA